MEGSPERRQIVRTALLSRVLITCLQFIANVVISDHNADAFRFVRSPERRWDGITFYLFGGFVRWDAHHFMHIARYGYVYEHSLAFFPLYPMLVRYLAVILGYFKPFLSLDSVILLIFLVINVGCFVLAALCLYELTRVVFNDKSLALKASLLYCYNPASVFFSAPYSECLFSYLSFKSMLNSVLIYKKFSRDRLNLQVSDVFYVIPICLSVLTRSNGVLNIGFLAYIMVCLFLRKDRVFFTIKFGVCAFLLLIISLVPFVLFQCYAFRKFCQSFDAIVMPDLVQQQAKNHNFVLPGTFLQHNQSWCYDKIPLAYSYIQSHYWKVGFLQYFQIKQIPNFLLATPVIFIIMTGAYKFFKKFPKDFSQIFSFSTISQKQTVFIVHAVFLTLFCIFNVHVQVTNRMLCSASPTLYWFAAHGNKWIWGYFLVYYLLGTVMFCNFLPWT